jgi:hypothetical protein
VLGTTASEKWTSTARGLEIGGRKGFGFDELEYEPFRRSCKLRSVINEFNSSVKSKISEMRSKAENVL